MRTSTTRLFSASLTLTSILCLTGCLRGTKTIVARQGTRAILSQDAKGLHAQMPDDKGELQEVIVDAPRGSLLELGNPPAPIPKPADKPVKPKAK